MNSLLNGQKMRQRLEQILENTEEKEGGVDESTINQNEVSYTGITTRGN